MNAQLELEFTTTPTIWTREQHWFSLGYDGPALGKYCDINPLLVDLESGGTMYAYMEQCRLIFRTIYRFDRANFNDFTIHSTIVFKTMECYSIPLT